MPSIGISQIDFGVSEALALYLIRSVSAYKSYKITILQSALNQQSELIIVDGINDLKEKPFTIDKTRDQTLEKLIGLESYNQPLSIAGLVYTDIGHTIIMQKFPERYDLLINSQHIVQRNLNRDFRKIYEFFIEVVDSFHFGKELVYSTPEKKELYAYLQNLKNRMKNANYEGGESFVAFAEEFSNEIGERFENTLDWYMDSYLPAFDALILAIKKSDHGVCTCDFDFSKVTFTDLLVRASSNLMLPRLIIRHRKQLKTTRYRLEVIKLVKPILYFPKEWVGNGQHIYDLLGVNGIDYISTGCDFAIAQTKEAAQNLADHLLKYAGNKPQLIVSQQEAPNYENGDLGRPYLSLPQSRADSRESVKNEVNLKSVKEVKEEVTIKATENDDIKKNLVDDDEKNASFDAWDIPAEDLRFDFGTTEGQKTREEKKVTANYSPLSETPPTAPDNNNYAVPDAEQPILKNSETSSSSHSVSYTPLPASNFRISPVLQQSQPTTKDASKTFVVNVEEQIASNNADLLHDMNLQNDNISDGEEGEDVTSQVAKIMRPINKDGTIAYMGIPDNKFTLAHLFAAAIVAHALGDTKQTLKLQTLDKPNSLIRIGPDLYDYQDVRQKYTRNQITSMLTFDLSQCNRRFSIAGIAFAIHGKRAIARIVADESPEMMATFLTNDNGRKGKEKIASIYRRTFKRLVEPLDKFVQQDEPSFPLETPELNLFYQQLTPMIADASGGEINGELGFNCFLTALYVMMAEYARLVRSLLQ